MDERARITDDQFHGNDMREADESIVDIMLQDSPIRAVEKPTNAAASSSNPPLTQDIVTQAEEEQTKKRLFAAAFPFQEVSVR